MPAERSFSRHCLLESLAAQQQLPAFPEVVTRLDQELRSLTVSDRAIADLIKTDLSLSGRILQVANSVYYAGGRREVTSLSMAITRLGHRKIREITYALSLSKLNNASILLDHRRFWRHSIGVACFSQALCRHTGFPQALEENAYLAGLMHDVGIIVFSVLIPEEYGKFLMEIAEKENSLASQEKAWFGIDHAELGYEYIKRWWPVAETVASAIAGHHAPVDPRDSVRRISQLVNLSNTVCNFLNFDNGVNIYSSVFSESAWLALGIALDDVEGLLEEVQTGIRYAEDLLGFV